MLPAGLAPLFNGRDLSGWRCVEPPGGGGQPAEWTVRDGQIHVEKGPGQLETETAWDDFVLQAQIRVNTVDSAFHPNSGIFLRGDQEAWWSGYESQIRNEFAAKNPAQAVDLARADYTDGWRRRARESCLCRTTCTKWNRCAGG